MLAGQPAQQLRPGALQHGVDGGVTRAGQLAQGPRGLLRHPKRCHASPPQPRPARRPHQGRGVKTGQHLTPRRAGGIEVTIGQPGDKAAIRRGRGQPLPVIAGEYLPQQDRQRPAIHHDVVISQHKPVPIICGADQRRPKGRLVGQIAHRGAFGGTHPLDLLIDIARSASSSTYRHGTTGSAGMTCTGSSNCAQNRATRFGCRLTTVCTASRSRWRVQRHRSR